MSDFLFSIYKTKFDSKRNEDDNDDLNKAIYKFIDDYYGEIQTCIVELGLNQNWNKIPPSIALKNFDIF